MPKIKLPTVFQSVFIQEYTAKEPLLVNEPPSNPIDVITNVLPSGVKSIDVPLSIPLLPVILEPNWLHSVLFHLYTFIMPEELDGLGVPTAIIFPFALVATLNPNISFALVPSISLPYCIQLFSKKLEVFILLA